MILITTVCGPSPISMRLLWNLSGDISTYGKGLEIGWITFVVYIKKKNSPTVLNSKRIMWRCWKKERKIKGSSYKKKKKNPRLFKLAKKKCCDWEKKEREKVYKVFKWMTKRDKVVFWEIAREMIRVQDKF